MSSLSSTRALAIEGLTAGYDQAAVIRDVDMTVDAGEVVALLGANGAGKTTTLRVISGIVKPIGGRVTLDGEDLASLSPSARARLPIAHVPEGRGIFFGLTVAEHFRLGHRGEQLDAELAYEYFPKLEALRQRRAGLLSGGEQQMLAIGRALARHPRFLLLDELSLGLAPVIVESLLPDRSRLRPRVGLRRAPRRAARSPCTRGGRPRLRPLARRDRPAQGGRASFGATAICSSPATWESVRTSREPAPRRGRTRDTKVGARKPSRSE